MEKRIPEPDVTPRIIAEIPICLYEFIEMLVSMQAYQKGIKPIRFSSETLANRFIYLTWNIDLEQERQYENLFSTIRKACNKLFAQLLEQERISWNRKGITYAFRIEKGNQSSNDLVLEFKSIQL